MSNQITVKTNFTSGQVSPQLYARGDLKVFANGAGRLDNIIIFPTGGVSRRHGLRYIADIAQGSRLVSFTFNTEQTYLLVFEPLKVKIFRKDNLIAELDSLWTAGHLPRINWTQSADTLLVVHPDVPPMQISRYNDEVWKIEEWKFYTKDNIYYYPYANFYQKKISIKSVSGYNNTRQRLEADQDIFDQSWVGQRLRVNGGECIIAECPASNQVLVDYVTKPSNNNPCYDWSEPAFSARRGYPRSVTFHQDRMVIGGSKSLPNHLWLSKSSDLFNFDIGEGKDDDSIDFSILSDQVNAIVNVVSSRHLQVFTTGAEWMVTGDPLTPTSIQLRRQTNVGSYDRCSLLPQNVDGATLFISQSGRQMREFLYADVEQAYQAKDLTLLSTNIINQPVEMAYHQDESVLYVVLADGTASCLTSYRTEEVTAWSKLKTDGFFRSVAVIGEDIFFAVEREGKTTLEQMDDRFFVDCGIRLTSNAPQKQWSGLNHLEGKEVNVVADGFNVGRFTVRSGAITLHEDAGEIIAGLPYEHIIEPLPFIADAAMPYFPQAYRVIYGVFRLLETQALRIDLGSGFCDVPLRQVTEDAYYDAPAKKYTGDVELRALGWIRDMKKPMWLIVSDKPCPFTLLGAVLEVKIK